MAITPRQAINAFCLQCQDQNPWRVGNCAKLDCPLHPVRPNQLLHGKQEDDYDPDDVRQELLDALSYHGMKELSNVRSGHPRVDRSRTRTRTATHRERDATDPTDE